MKASIGDRIIVVSTQLGGPVREGRVVELRHPDGTPPYVVEWFDTGARSLYFPGSDGHVLPGDPDQEAAASAHRDLAHAKTWKVEIHVFEQGPTTTARAVLRAESDTDLEGRGKAHRAPADMDVPEIGDEVAVARALHRLADSLLAAASADISAVEQRRVTLTR
jgi:hypothetical protein